jgi:hypothetical protein
MAPKPTRKPLKRRVPKRRPAVHPLPDDFDLLFEQYSFRERDKDDDTYDMGILRYRHQNVWSSLTRAQIAFLHDRMCDFLEDTGAENHFVYVMICEHTTSSPYRLSSQARVHCPEHGFQRLDPRHNADMMLPTWKEWLAGQR